MNRTDTLNTIPEKKIQAYLEAIELSDADDRVKHVKKIVANRYAESNIPIEYWDLSMKDFRGDARLLDRYNAYTADLAATYGSGESICLAGNHGTGKTTAVCNVLKKATHKGYSCLYTTLSDVVSVLTTNSSDKFQARKELILVDWLVIDEVDNRFMATDNAADLFARNLESVLRARFQNTLPVLMCTNSPNVVGSFNGTLHASLESLFKGYVTTFPVFGDDFRKTGHLQAFL